MTENGFQAEGIGERLKVARTAVRLASNLAAAGIAQWKIDAILGHHTVEMQKRYRHLFPDQRVNVFKQLRNGREENGVSAATPQLLPG